MKLTERKIVKALNSLYFTGTQVNANNIYLYANYESDFIRVTNSGYITEFEVKLSVADFKNDLKKKGYHGLSKLEYIRQGYAANSFCYVMPKEIADKVEIPEWAGLITAHIYSGNESRFSGVICDIVKNFKKIHTQKISQQQLFIIYRSLTARYWNYLPSK